MMNRGVSKNIDTIILLLSVAGLTGIITAAFLISNKFVLCLVIFGCSVDVAVCVFLTRIIARSKFVQFTESICKQLDYLIENKPEYIDSEDETLDSKIGAKLLKIKEITRGTAQQSEQLKKRVQESVSDITHQLKTPLSSIKMAAESLDEGNTDNQRQFFISCLKSQVSKLEFLIEAMTKISRLENGTIVPKPEPSPLAELLEAAVTAILPMADEKKIKIESVKTKLILSFDMRWTVEALFNILDNAVKYTPDCGGIFVSVHPLALYTRIDISDTGIGVLPEHINEIFKRFYRENRIRKTNGIGVGLYLSREIISKQGGYIIAKSTVDKGTTISVYLQNSDSISKIPKK